MRQIIFILTLLGFLFGFDPVSYAPAPVYACVNWGEPQCKIKSPSGDESCDVWYTPCLDIDNPGQSTCDSGYYSCNRADTDPSGHYQCCPVGSGGGGGANYQCDWGQIDCPPGQVKNVNDYSDYCGLNTGCPNVGSAQAKIPPGCGGDICLDRKCWINQNGVEKCKCLEWGYRRQTIRTYSCTPTGPVCSASGPTAPILTSPANGASFSDIDATLLWNATDFGTACTTSNPEYEVYVGESNPPTALDSSMPEGFTPLEDTFIGEYGKTYYWFVRANNGEASADSEIRSFSILDNEIAGTIYYDVNNTCSSAVPWTTSALSVSANPGGYSDSTSTGDGSYVIAAPPASNTYTLSFAMPGGFICSSGSGCNTCSRSSIDSPSSGSGNNFYISDSRAAWWQGVGASIYAGSQAGGVVVRSELFGSNTLIAPGLGGAIGALMRSSGSVDSGTGSISTPGYSTLMRYRGKTMDYSAFATQIGVLPSQSNDWGSDTMNKPSAKAFHYLNPSGASASLTAPWAVGSSDEYIIFIDGDLRINHNITVADGGFVAFIVNGGVTVSSSVTSMEGLYVMDDNFVTEASGGNDSQLAVEGSVVTWGSADLRRDLGNSNATLPAEKFTYRPDLLVNMPDSMKVFALRWSEVVPGTF